MKKTKIANETRQNNGPYIANGYAENHINENNNNMENERQNVKNMSNEYSKFRAENNSNCCDGCENDLPSVRRQLDRPPTTSVEKLIKKLEDCRLLAAAEQNAAEKSENSNFGSTVSSLLNVSSTNSGSRKDENLNSNLTGKGAASVVAKNIVEAAVDFVENMVIYSPESEEISVDSKLAEKKKLNLNKKADENSLLPNNADDYALIDGSLLNTREIFAPFSDDDETSAVRLVQYKNETQMPDIMRLITKDLSEPYSIYTYRYFIHNWPHLCFLAKADDGKYVGAIVCKLSLHARGTRRGYIAMLAVDEQYRRLKIGTKLVTQAIEAMIQQGCDEVVLETEVTNKSALKLYENLGFVRDKRLFRYYLNGVDAFRLKLWLKPPQLVQYL